MLDTSNLQVSGSLVLYKNDDAMVSRAVRSFFSSSLAVSLTVVDNSPRDNLRAIAESLGARYVWNGRNTGFGAAHNRAIRDYLGTSQYHLVLNPDVAFRPDVLPRLFEYMEKHHEVGLVMPRVVYPDGEEQRLCKLLPTPFDLFARRFMWGPVAKLTRSRMERYLLANIDLTVPREVPSLSGCFMFLRSEVLSRVGLFDERYFMYLEDVDLCRRVRSAALTVIYPEVTIEHGYAKGSYRDTRLLVLHMQSAFKYFCKWGWFFDHDRDKINKAIGSSGILDSAFAGLDNTSS